MGREDLEFPEIAEVPGLEKASEVIDEIRRDMPFSGKDARLAGRESLIEESVLLRSLRAAYTAGALGSVASMQLSLNEREIDVDLTREVVHAQLAAEWGLLGPVESVPTVSTNS